MNDPSTPPSDAASINMAGVDQEIDPVMVTMSFATDRVDELLAVLSKYVVLARMDTAAGRLHVRLQRMDTAARNIDLVASLTLPGRFTIVEKWATEAAQQAHFDSSIMVDMATACTGLLTEPPDIDLHEAVSMHDLG